MLPPVPSWVPPTREQIRQRSDDLGLYLSPEMLDASAVIAPGLAGMYNAVGEWWRQRLPTPPLLPVSPGDDPYQATEYLVDAPPTGDGSLSCLNLAVKDSIHLAGAPMAYGSRLIEGHIARSSATVVDRARASGARITHIGRADDLGLAITGDQNFHGPVLNPWHTGHTTWGSSAGPAALVAARLTDAAIMVDQAGSARAPGAGTGLAVLVPTRGLVPMTGAIGFTAVQDRIGFGARHVAHLDTLFRATAGPDGRDLKAHYGPPCVDRGIRRLRIGVVSESLDPSVCDPAVADRVRASVEQLREAGAIVRTVSVKRYADASALALVLSVQKGVMDALASNMGNDGSVLFGDAELADQAARRHREHPEWLARTVQLSAAAAASNGGQEQGLWTAAAMELIPHLTRTYTTHFEGRHPFDLLLTPTVPSVPPTVPDASMSLVDVLLRALGPGITHTCSANLTGLPAGQAPAGLVDGLPVGIQFIAPRYAEQNILCAIRALQPACGFPAAGEPPAGPSTRKPTPATLHPIP